MYRKKPAQAKLVKRSFVKSSFKKHFSNMKAKPVGLSELIPANKPVVAYNSHGSWSTLGAIREIEVDERGNDFPELPFPDDTPAIWVCLSKRMALRYLESADQWDRLMSDAPLTEEDKELMADIGAVELQASDVIAFTDFDEGYLILRPKK